MYAKLDFLWVIIEPAKTVSVEKLGERMNRVIIIGSGLAGSLLAIFLAQRGYAVDIFEARTDGRLAQKNAGRSINLALSCRGLTALKKAGLDKAVKKLMVPMRARAIHEGRQSVAYQSFGRHRDEYINAIQRCDLNNMLLDEVEKFDSVRVHFNCSLRLINFNENHLTFENENKQKKTVHYTCLIGADGASSFVRESMQQQGFINYSRTFLEYGYKEIAIAPATNSLAREHLHLWPRDDYLLLGNPNTDNSITGSLFLPLRGKNSFESLDGESKVSQFFNHAFPDISSETPNLMDDFLQHPTGNMSTIACSNWFAKNCLLIGDAAHGVVPFFGQGMNCAFEDCRVLNDLLITYDDDWSKVRDNFYRARLANSQAVAAMSLANFYEIQSGIRSEAFNFKKQLELQLMHRYADTYVSKHVLVMFTNTSYTQALEVGNVQSVLLNTIYEHFKQSKSIDWSFIDGLIVDYDKILTKTVF